jgi:hypothetical protein
VVQQSVKVQQEFGIGPLPLKKNKKLLMPRLLNKEQQTNRKKEMKQQPLRLKLKQKQKKEQKMKQPKQPKLPKKPLRIKRRKNRKKYKLVNLPIALEKPSLSSQSTKRKLLRKALSMAKHTRKPLWDMLSLHLPSSPSS